MDERLSFVALVPDGESMSDACRAFGISRKTGYKLFNRHKEYGDPSPQTRSARQHAARACQVPIHATGQ